MRQLMWGKSKESGVWWARTYRWRLMWNDHDSLYVCVGKVRLRLMKRRKGST
jgi:hypothetical protein